MNILDKVAMEKIEFAPESIRAKLLEIDSLVEESKKETGIKKIGINKVLLEQLIELNNDPLFIQFKEERLTEKAEKLEDTFKERKSTSQFYSVREKGISRQKLNDQAIDLIAEFDKNPLRKPTDEEKTLLAKFSGFGGGLIDKTTGQKGSAYQYYTPKPIAEGVWDCLKGLGFNGGKVLDPSSGTGIFGATAPLRSVVDAVELSNLSGRINQLVNDGPGYKATISNFEKVAARTEDNVYDAVVTNVPFGDV